MGGQHDAPARSTPGKDPLHRGVRRALEPIWTGAENLTPTAIRFPDCPARSASLYRMSSPGRRLFYLRLWLSRVPKWLVVERSSRKEDISSGSVHVNFVVDKVAEAQIFLVVLRCLGDRGRTVVKVLCYKSEGRWFDYRWCPWKFS